MNERNPQPKGELREALLGGALALVMLILALHAYSLHSVEGKNRDALMSILGASLSLLVLAGASTSLVNILKNRRKESARPVTHHHQDQSLNQEPNRPPSSLHPSFPGPSIDPYIQACTELGISPGAKWHTVKAAWRSTAKQHHPDYGGDSKTWMRKQAAYQFLEAMYQLKGDLPD